LPELKVELKVESGRFETPYWKDRVGGDEKVPNDTLGMSFFKFLRVFYVLTDDFRFYLSFKCTRMDRRGGWAMTTKTGPRY
jgi:hypothetical protein